MLDDLHVIVRFDSCFTLLLSFLLLFVCVSSKSMCLFIFFFFQAEDGIRDLVRSRGLGDVYKRQALGLSWLLSLSKSHCCPVGL